MASGFDVDPAALNAAGGKISESVSGMERLRLASLVAPAADFGHADVHRALVDFCTGAELAAQALARASESASAALHDTAKSYVDRDQEAGSTVRKAVGDASGEAW
ncbi:hypothetical protein [Saccharopolyspora flava]|uniref:Excreted virulence factor EspC, type VII ESX diderm n=1 Tax=Saccharopolyspora flava TaxID=95161 RepID=A0A1I6UXV3_9PSEU|nr:hypothetical protein [Saccharopolyspora flava]SFT06252.1 hypothetical protein SAMN05660874_05360 [Saccharopolyspora flava]